MKTPIRSLFVPFLILSFLSASVWAQEAGLSLKLHNIFADNMVIQRDRPIKVWGWAKPGTEVSVSLGEDAAVSKAEGEKGGWSVTFQPRAASSDPIALSVSAGGESISYDNIVFGDVWVMNGQSNMAWPLSNTLEVGLRSLQADLPQLRLMKITPNEQKELADNIPIEKIATNGWVVSTPESAMDVSGIGVAFGVNLQRALNIPIGIIDNSRGGASIESLVPERKLLEHPLTKRYYEYVKQREAEFSAEEWLAGKIEAWENKVERERKKGTSEEKLPSKPRAEDIRSWAIPGMSPSDSGSCYNGMFGAFIGYNIKGVLFHQGFNNKLGGNCRPKRYRIIMKQMIEGWREDFNEPDMPVGIIGFCAGETPQTNYNFESIASPPNGAFIREAQRLGLADVGDPANTAFLPSFDVQIRGLHPKKKYEHGERAARWALNRVYEKEVKWDTAKLVSSEVVGDEIVLTFDKRVYPHNMSVVPEGFAVAGEDGVFYKAYARFRSDKPLPPTEHIGKYDATNIHIWSPLVDKPIGVRYGWADSPLGNLYVEGMPWAPLASFRTDEWDLPEDEDPSVEGLPGRDHRAERSQAQEYNEERLAKEAEIAVEINERLKTLGIVEKTQ